MATITVKKRKGTYRISYNGNTLHKDKDLKFVNGWLQNQVKDFKELYIEL